MSPDVGKFVTGEIVWWKSLASNKDLTGVVIRQIADEQLGDRVIVRSKLSYLHCIRSDRLNRPRASGVTLCGPGMLA